MGILIKFHCWGCDESPCICRGESKRVKSTHLKFTSTIPVVTVGDIVTTSTLEEIKVNKFNEYLVEEINEDFEAIVSNINNPKDRKQLKEPYYKVAHSIKDN